MRTFIEGVIIFTLLLSPALAGTFFDQQSNQSITQEH